MDANFHFRRNEGGSTGEITAQDDYERDLVRYLHEQKNNSELNSAELQSIVEQFDFELIGIIFEEVTGKKVQPVKPERMLFRAKSKTDKAQKTPGSYIVEQDIIVLLHDAIEAQAQKIGIPIELAALHTTLHEETHATSHTTCRITTATEGDQIKVKKFNIQSGFQRIIKHEEDDIESYFRLFDEAVTEKTAREVLFNYLKRDTALSQKIGSMNIDKLQKYFLEKRDGFAGSITFLEACIAHISSITKFDPEIVWKALRSAKFHGSGFDDAANKQALGVIFSDDFLSRLAQADTEKDLQHLQKSWGQAGQKQSLIHRWIEKILRTPVVKK